MLRTSDQISIPDLKNLCNIFDMLSDETRLKIVLLLMDGERNVGRLTKELNQRQPTVSHHLGLLRAENLITARRSGKNIIYSLSHKPRDMHSLFAMASTDWSIHINTMRSQI